jgi:hypothetical protein
MMKPHPAETSQSRMPDLTRTGWAEVGPIEVRASASAAAHDIFTTLSQFIIFAPVRCASLLGCIIDQIQAAVLAPSLR